MPARTLRQSIAAPQLDLDAVATVEAEYYESGFKDGDAHGRLHGKFEGRRLGAEKGFELWNEIASIDAFAKTWLCVLEQPSNATLGTLDGQPASQRRRTKQMQQLESLVGAISAIPTDNLDADLDVGAALERIRAKYRLACFSLGVSSDMSHDARRLTDAGNATESRTESSGIIVKGRRVDANQLNF